MFKLTFDQQRITSPDVKMRNYIDQFRPILHEKKSVFALQL